MTTPFDSARGAAGASLGLEELEVNAQAAEAPDAGAPAAEAPGAARVTLDDVLDEHTAPSVAPLPARKAQPLGAAMRTARVASISGRRARILMRGADEPVDAEVAPEVDPEVIAEAHLNQDAVLVELCEGEAPLIVAALRTRRPQAIHLKATTITMEGERELLLRSGRAAIRIREDGDIEVVGSRISAASRGLFRIVGRLLRLN